MLSSILVPSALMDPDHPLSTELWKWAASIRHLMWKSSAPLSCKFGQNSITSRDVKSTCFKGSRMSCDVANFGVFFAVILARKGHITWWMLLAEKKTLFGKHRLLLSDNWATATPPNHFRRWVLSFAFFLSLVPVIWPGLLPDSRAYQGWERVFSWPFLLQTQEISRKCSEMAPFFRRESQVVRNSGDVPF